MSAKQQADAIARLRMHIDRRIGATMRDEHGKEITRFEIEPLCYGSIKVVAEVDCTKLSTDSLLRFVEHEFWLAFIGPRGKIEVKMAPKSYKQFDGRRAFGMTFDL